MPAFSDQLDFVAARTGWATTYTAKNEAGQPTNAASILTTGGGGRTWTRRFSVSGAGPAIQIDFVDASNGWALEADPADCGGTDCSSYSLLRTKDGGRTWTKLQESKPPSAWWSPRNNVSVLGAPRFASASVGWIPIPYDGGANPDGVLLTGDGGGSWARVA